MIQLSPETIAAAKANDIAAITAVVEATEEFVLSRARRFADQSGHVDMSTMEDLAQIGRIAVWQALARFDGHAFAQFMVFIDRSVSGAMSDARREETRRGVSAHAAKVFEEALTLSGGDPYEAERVAASQVMGKDRLLPDLAHAAYLSWLGVDYLDRTLGDAAPESATLGQLVAETASVPEDLVDSRDIATHRRTVIRDQVHKTLGALSDRQRHVLKAGFGIAPVAQYQPGADDDELAGDMGATRYQVQQSRTKGTKRFAELYRAGARAW
ncbi:sigma-70 family RNA polymerase sigma factor [Streptomyces sp. NPDC058572]|uniref:sigma-70 family RNA polymerase sigma factor n=1 Tax=Streptomyces sp. NPDC058572 TaxID=3346546 RepID=UPI00366487AB